MMPLVGLSAVMQFPLPWVILGGLCAGAALSKATRRTRHAANPEHAAAWKWTIVCLYLSLAIIAGLLAVFIPGPQHIMDSRLAWVAAIAAGVSFFALRFKRALGIPIMVLLVALVIVFALFLQSVHAFTGQTEIASLRAISVDSDSMRLQLVPRGGEPVLLTMKGTQFAPIVRVVIFSDLFVFMGAHTWYRFDGMTSFNQDLRQQDTDFRFPRPAGISEQLWQLFEKYDNRIPGVRTVQIEMILKEPKEFASYGIMVRNDGGVEVVQKSE